MTKFQLCFKYNCPKLIILFLYLSSASTGVFNTKGAGVSKLADALKVGSNISDFCLKILFILLLVILYIF